MVGWRAAGGWIGLSWLAAMLAGCSVWSLPADLDSPLKLPQMSPDSVVLEVAVLDVPAGETWDREELWREVDEQCLPLETRQRLSAAGLRAGILGTQLPAWVRSHLESQQKAVDFENKDGAMVLGDVATQQRLQCRAGNKRPIQLGKRRAELKLPPEFMLSATDGDGRLPPALKDAQCEMLITTLPQGDGPVQIDLVPQVRHGPLKRRWVARNGSFHIDAGSDCEVCESLRMKLKLKPGQTAVIGSAAAATAAASDSNNDRGNPIGKIFFEDQPRAGFQRRLLLIRLAQTQRDDLFAPHAEPPPIATLGQ